MLSYRTCCSETWNLYKYNAILQHPIVLCRPSFLIYFFPSTCNFVCFSFFPLMQIRIICFTLTGHLLVYKLVLRGNCYNRGLFFRLVLCCNHARVQFYCILRIFLLFQCVAVLDVFVCCIRCTLLGCWDIFKSSHLWTLFKNKMKLKLIYDRQSVGQSILVSGPHLGPATNFSFSLIFPSVSCVFVIL
jgi:hypothetical protein